MSVRLDIAGKDAALAALARAAAGLAHPKPLYDEVGAALAVSTQVRFEREADPDGNPWAPSLRKLVAGGRTLTETARLVSSITHEATDAGVAVGTNVLYAAIHQTGGTIRARTSRGLRFRSPGNGGWVTKQQVTIPRRAFLGVDREDEAEIEAIAGSYTLKPLGGRDGP